MEKINTISYDDKKNVSKDTLFEMVATINLLIEKVEDITTNEESGDYEEGYDEGYADGYNDRMLEESLQPRRRMMDGSGSGRYMRDGSGPGCNPSVFPGWTDKGGFTRGNGKPYEA